MKKTFITLLAAALSLTAFGQKEGDKITINTTETGRTTEWNLAGESNAVSSLRHTADGKLEVYLKGWEDFGAWETYDVGKISSVIFNVQRESDVSGVTLADAAASDATKRMYKYLRMNYGSRTFSSVIADVNWNHDLADQLYAKTGKYPAFNCYDFIHIYVPQDNNWIDYNDVTPVTEWADAGGLVSLMWHFNVPTAESVTIGTDGSGVTTDPTQTTFQAANALVDGTWEHTWFYAQMDKVAAVLLKLQDAGVTATWRPFHEAAGNSTLKSGASWAKAWFWWGADGADTYKQLWQAMFTYFQSKGVHNLIWVWTSQNYNGDSTLYNSDADWYPGDAYVDIIGRDLYGYTAARQKTEFAELQARYPAKLIDLSECGTDANTATATAAIADSWAAGARWLGFMPWYGSSMPDDAWWNAAFAQEAVITRDEVDLNATIVAETAREAVVNMGLGVSLGNTLDANGVGTGKAVSDYETYWGQPVTTQAMADFLRDGGIRTVRIPVTWYEHLDADGNVDEAWMDRVQQVVDYVVGNGMYCVLNVHHDTAAGDGAWVKADAANYAANHQRFENLWTQIATRFRDYDQHLLFEGYNEMLDAANTWSAPASTDSYAALNSYAQSFVNAVRATGGNNNVRNLIVNTYAAANSQPVIDALTLPTDAAQGHLAVQIHSYDPWNWYTNYGAWTAACSTNLTDMLARLNTRFVSQGVPVIIGEYGTHGDTSVSGSSTDSQKQAAADQAADMVRQAKALGIATIYWNSIFDGSDRTVPQWTLPTVVEAMKQAYNE